MKFFKNMLIFLIAMTLYGYSSSSIPSSCSSITLLSANDINNAPIVNTSSAVDISDLSGTPDANCPEVEYFIITSLPAPEQGVLYMADGTTPVTVNQQLSVAEAQGLKFDPKASFTGNATFTYRVKDSVGTVSSNMGTVSIPVENSGGHPGGGTDIPTADDKTHTTAMSNQWGPTNILNLSGKDSDGNAVSEFQIKSLPTAAQGVLYMADGTTLVTLNQTLTKDEADGLKFDPKEGFVGDAIFTYVAIDGNGKKSNPATVTIPVANSAGGGNQGGEAAPITDNRLNPKILNTAGATNITDLSGTDKDGNAVTKFIITELPDANEGVLYMADGTTAVTVNQELTLEEANGLKFDPKAEFIGDATFRYAAIDGAGVRGNVATVTIPVGSNITENDKKPTADDKINRQLSNTLGAVNIVNLSGTDKDGNAVTKFIVTKLPDANEGVLYMADGTTPVTLNQELTLEEANGLKFDPKEGFVGNATFRYASIDNSGVRGDEATVTIPVGNGGANGNIVANNDVAQAEGGADPIHINVLENDTGVPAGAVVRLVGANGALTDRLVVEGEGIWTVGANNIVTFTPVAPFVGTPTPIQYVVQDGSNGDIVSNRATITIEGQCVCEPYESSIDALSTFGLLVMLFFSSLLGLNLLRKEFN